jgi:hypothetical protein
MRKSSRYKHRQPTVVGRVSSASPPLATPLPALPPRGSRCSWHAPSRTWSARRRRHRGVHNPANPQSHGHRVRQLRFRPRERSVNRIRKLPAQPCDRGQQEEVSVCQAVGGFSKAQVRLKVRGCVVKQLIAHEQRRKIFAAYARSGAVTAALASILRAGLAFSALCNLRVL